MEQTIAIIPQMLEEAQVAKSLAVSVGALRRWRREGRGPEFTRVQRCVRYDLRAIERFLIENGSKFQPSLSQGVSGRPVCEFVDTGKNAHAAQVQP